jgi:polyphosphate kinase
MVSTPQEHALFLQQTAIFEQLLIDDGILLRKYWFRWRHDDPARQSKRNDGQHRQTFQPLHLLSTIDYRPVNELSTYVDDHVATLLGSSH